MIKGIRFEKQPFEVAGLVNVNCSLLRGEILSKLWSNSIFRADDDKTS